MGRLRFVLAMALAGGCGGDGGAPGDADAPPLCEAPPDPLCAPLPSSAELPVCESYAAQCPTYLDPDDDCDRLYQLTIASGGLHLFTSEFEQPPICGGAATPHLELLAPEEACGLTTEPIACGRGIQTECEQHEEISACLEAGQEIVIATSGHCGEFPIRVEHSMPGCELETLGPGAPASQLVRVPPGAPQLFHPSCADDGESARPQGALEFVAPAAGEYRFRSTGYDKLEEAAVLVLDGGCCGEELACARTPGSPVGSDAPPTSAEVVVTLAAGQRVVVVGQSDNPTTWGADMTLSVAP